MIIGPAIVFLLAFLGILCFALAVITRKPPHDPIDQLRWRLREEPAFYIKTDKCCPHCIAKLLDNEFQGVFAQRYYGGTDYLYIGRSPQDIHQYDQQVREQHQKLGITRKP